jgi:hypothetical protein
MQTIYAPKGHVMRQSALSSLIATVLMSGLYATSAYALQDTAWVDPNAGSDSNACTQAAPCQTVTHAQTTVNDPGLIIILPGVVSPFTITTSLSVVCSSGHCSVSNSTNNGVSAGTSAITISAPNKGVTLSGLALSAFGTQSGAAGISVTDVGKLEVKNMSISGEPIGINFTPGSGTNSHLLVDDSEIRNSATRDVVIAPTSSNSASAEVTNSRINHANAGIVADASTGTGGVSVVVNRSEVSFMNNNNVNVIGNASGAAARVMLDGVVLSHSAGNCISSNNTTATVAMSKTMVTQCTTALLANGGGIFTYGDNAINFNTSNGSTPTTAGGFR